MWGLVIPHPPPPHVGPPPFPFQKPRSFSHRPPPPRCPSKRRHKPAKSPVPHQSIAPLQFSSRVPPENFLHSVRCAQSAFSTCHLNCKRQSLEAFSRGSLRLDSRQE